MREEFEHRKLVLLFVSYLVGLCSAWNFSILGLAFAPLLVARQWSWRAGLLLAVGLGFLLRPDVHPALVIAKREFEGQVRLLSVPVVSGQGMKVLVESDQGRLDLRLPGDATHSLGDSLQVSGTLRPLSEASGFDHGAIGMLEPVGSLTTISKGPVLWRWCLRVRQSFVGFIAGSAPSAEGQFLDAMAFNVTSGLDQPTATALRRTGTSHLVATAGLHLTVVAGALLALLSTLRLNREWQILALCAFLCLYAGAAGLRPPIIRALLMALSFAAAYLFRREPDPLTSLCLGAGLVTIRDPAAIMDPGLWLTLAALGSIILFIHPKPGVTWRQVLREISTGALIITASTMPLIALFYGEISMVSALVNVLVLPFVGIILVISLGSWLVSLALPQVGLILLQTFALPILQILEGFIKKCSSWPWAALSVPSFHPAWLLLFYASAVLLWRPFVREA